MTADSQNEEKLPSRLDNSLTGPGKSCSSVETMLETLGAGSGPSMGMAAAPASTLSSKPVAALQVQRTSPVSSPASAAPISIVAPSQTTCAAAPPSSTPTPAAQ